MMESQAPLRAMILAAGLGTRLKPWTDFHPKALAIVNGKSLLQRNIEFLQRAGIREVIVNVHHFAEQIREAIEINKGWGSDITISDEAGEVLETGGGLKKAGWYFSAGDFVLLNADILTDLRLTDMLSRHKERHALATLAVTKRETSRYFLFDREGRLGGWQNIKTGEKKILLPGRQLFNKAFSGVHIISPKIFQYMTMEGKFSIVDLYLSLAAGHQIQSFDHSDSRFVDVGKPESIALAGAMFE